MSEATGFGKIELGRDYSKPASFGDVRTFDVYVPTGRFTSVDVIESMGWHKVNKQYHIRRPKGTDGPLILFTVSGQGSVTIGENTFRVSRDSVCFAPAFTPCEYGQAGDNLWEFYWLHFSGEHALAVFEDIVRTAGFCRSFPVASIQPLLERCLNTRFAALSGELLASAFLDQILTKLLLDFGTGGRNTTLVDALILFLGEYRGTTLSMNELEREFHYSKEHIIRTFRKQTNATPYRYWREIKMA